jgi:serine protease Do
MRLAKLALAVNLALSASAFADPGPVGSENASVLKVRVTAKSGEHSHGSAVVIGRSELITNCHVVKNAHRIELMDGYEIRTARVRGGDADKDLCVLAAPEVEAPIAMIGTTARLAIGETVHAVGFPGGGSMVESRGLVESLYSFQGARVIQTSAEFNPGASGGALFNEAGELVGILTFKAPGGGTFHFAVPVDWVAELAAEDSEAADRAKAFWEAEPEHRAPFLRAAWLEANEQWPALFAMAQHWAASDPESDEPKLSMVKAVERLLNSPTETPAVAQR